MLSLPKVILNKARDLQILRVGLRYQAVLAVGVLSGCTALESIGVIQEKVQAVRSTQVEPAQAEFQQRVTDTHRHLGQHIDRPWIVGKSQPLGRDITLPPALRTHVQTTLLFAAGQADLVALAARIYQASGIPVRVTPDALLPETAFLPRLSTEDAALTSQPPTQADTLIPPIVTAAFDSMVAQTLRTDKAVHPALPQGQAPLPLILDAIALRLGVHWRYDADSGAIVFFRTESRHFSIHALAQAAETALELGLTGAETNGSFTSSNKTAYTAKAALSPRMAVVAKIEHLLTRAGSVQAAEGGTNSLIVTDTPEVLARIATFLEGENKRLTRRVRLVFEEVTLQHEDTGQAGVDWNLIFTHQKRGLVAGMAGVGMLLDVSKAASNLHVSKQTDPWAGSGISLHALAEIGTILRHTQLPVLAINRRPATYAVRETFPYIKDLQQTQSTSDSTAPTVTVTQEKETVGTFLTVIPDAQDDGQVLLTLGYDTKRLVDLKKMEFGASQTASFVQQPYINGQGSTQQVIVHSGQRVLVAGFDQSDDNYKHRRLDKKAPMLFGGSDATQQKRVITLLFVTALAEEGG